VLLLPMMMCLSLRLLLLLLWLLASCLLLQLDPCNAIVLNSHLVCAAKELPLLPSEDG
jgi:hypothetical protein